MTVSFSTTAAEAKLIAQIAVRAMELFGRQSDTENDFINWQMDITACHCNGCRLDLKKLLIASAFDFLHDLSGIRRHLDGDTGRLGGCFLPRAALTQQKRRARQRGGRIARK